MRLNTQLLSQFERIEQRTTRLHEKFDAFVKGLESLRDSQCPVKGVTYTTDNETHAVVVRFSTVAVRLRLVITLDDVHGVAQGRIVCTLEAPRFAQEALTLGSFSFDQQGQTDFTDKDGDAMDLEYMAAEIALHYVAAGLKASAA